MVEIVPYPIKLSWEGDAAVAGGDKMATGGDLYIVFVSALHFFTRNVCFCGR